MAEEPADIGAEQTQEILDAKYAPADSPAEIAKLTHLTAEQRDSLIQILKHSLMEHLAAGIRLQWK